MSKPASSTMPEHLISLPDTGWAMWRWFALRGAGFPASLVLRLATPPCARAADHWLDCEAEVEQARQRLGAALSEEANNARSEARNRLLKTLRRLKEGKQLSALTFTPSPELQEHLDAFQAALTRKEQVRADFQALFCQATAQTMQVLNEVAQAERFREAVMWQNRGAVRDGIEPFLHTSITCNPTRKQRVHARLIAKYLQRYCTKNDSIGFFGPVGWGRWSDRDAALTVYPGAHLLASRTVYFETWGIDVLCETLSHDNVLLPWAIPRPMPFLFLSGATLHVPFARPLQLSHAQATVLAACDGQRTARGVAQTVLSTPRTSHPGLASEEDVFAVLDYLRDTRRIAWSFEVPIMNWYPERALRRQLEQIDVEPLRQRALRMLDRLETARTTVANAAGNVAQLNWSLEQLETTFTELTGRVATHDAGKAYAARTLIYEDCRRNLELTLGPALLQELARPLTLLLTSARWFTYTAARLYRKVFRKAYIDLARKTGSSTVNFAEFWSWIQPLITVEPGQLLTNTLVPEFQKRWATILDVADGQRRIRYTSDSLQLRVQETFRAPHAGWRSACYHSPDVLIAATGPEAIRHDDYELVLGEFHQGMNTLDVIGLVSQHPAQADLLRAIAADQPEPRVVPVFPRQTFSAKRTHAALVLPKDRYFVFGADSAGVPVEQKLLLGQLLLEECEGELIVRTRDRLQQFDLLEVLDGIISPQVCDIFKILAPASHTPRVSVDRLVICREAWRFAPDELPWAFHLDPLECYVGLRRWTRAQQMPRFLFVRTPNEVKPYYVDLDSAVYADLFAKAVRQAHAAGAGGKCVTITEMLPDPEHTWLPDANGDRYTSEMRMVAVDQLKPPVKNQEAIKALRNGMLSEEEIDG